MADSNLTAVYCDSFLCPGNCDRCKENSGDIEDKE